jgi:hypothetical protein
VCCSTCEGMGELTSCEGGCRRMFHATVKCLQAPVPDGDAAFICAECSTGRYTCFKCKHRCAGPPDEAVERCSVPSCGRAYHRSCLHDYPATLVHITKHHIRCPLHYCASCHGAKKLPTSSLIKCLRCPTAYHWHVGCIMPDMFTFPRSY